MQPFVASVSHIFIEMLFFIGSFSKLLQKSFKESLTRPFYFGLFIEQMYSIGIKSAPLVAVCAMSTGMVITIQFGFGLEKYGGKPYAPNMMALSMVRELGPVFTSLMMAGRVGAGIASEIGSMKVTQQIDAIRALGTSPIKKIVIPRLLALLVSLPLLTVLANTLGILSGLSVATLELGLDPIYTFQKTLIMITVKDYTVGIAKTFFFAIFIGLTACHYGMSVSEGTRGVGIATTKSVVASSILIVISDFVLTKLFWIVEKW